jgi:hypothetical protein
MHSLTQNYECWISKDGDHFTVHNIAANSADGGYKLGEYAEFKDGNVKYKVTISKSDTVDLQRVN